MTIYAMSDIHGFIGPFEEALAHVNLDDGASRLVLLGDYCDRGPSSLDVYRRIMGLRKNFPARSLPCAATMRRCCWSTSTWRLQTLVSRKAGCSQTQALPPRKAS